MAFFIINKNHINHKGTINLYTNRFLLRKFEDNDVNYIFDNWASCKEAARYNAWNVHSSIKETKEYLMEWIKNYDKLNYYNWAITNKETKEVIGSISVSNIKNRSRYCEIGYTIASKYWNNGIATEVLIRVLDYLVKEVGFQKIHAIYDVRNIASGRVMEKAGMVYLKNRKKFLVNNENMIMNCSIYEYKV
ncbi:MAG: GNAT family N-acetyltransferase [Tissierellia bacterium]|nr:GNAT family N-acetyltransferase [Tissierellia bacterium]MDD4779837.1 GNAT family N-acetyltransferase [Tissierellia bacterium]